KIITDRVILEASSKYSVNKKMEAKMGAKYKYIKPDVYSYLIENIEFEQHLDVYLSYFYQPIKELKATVNLRQMFVSNYKAPFTPSLGAEYTVFDQKNKDLTLTTSIAKSYRIPTFNDRFWGTQGKPDLKPENGFIIDAGSKYYFGDKSLNTCIKLNVFYMNIDDWIEWRLFSVWEASNVQQVISKGIELNTNTNFDIGKFSSNIILNYSLNSAQKIDSKETGELINQQLIYTPLNIGNIIYSVSRKNISVFANGLLTGKRYVEYALNNRESLPAYFLTNCGISYTKNIKNHRAKLTISGNNLFNVDYQNEQFYAMPGRNYQISIQITLHHI
ncbi:MAG: TonB-dependent receptor, partial [Prolixibacteraceae bacterium]|nr:TonB-dependent receptor [Prolixibacteraceae bacterium]